MFGFLIIGRWATQPVCLVEVGQLLHKLVALPDDFAVVPAGMHTPEKWNGIDGKCVVMLAALHMIF